MEVGHYAAHPSESRSPAQVAACGSHIIVVCFVLTGFSEVGPEALRKVAVLLAVPLSQ